MGGDNAPKTNLLGAYLASKELSKNEKIVLVGDDKLAKKWFLANNINSSIFDFIHADEVILMDEHATKALRKKPNNSISVGFKALKNKGFVKIKNFQKQKNKIAAIQYILTPKGIAERTKLTINFMSRKIKEYDELKEELNKN